MTIVGAWIEGAGIRSEGPPRPGWDGALSLVDVVISLKNAGPAITAGTSLVLSNVWVENAATVVCDREWMKCGSAGKEMVFE